MPFPKNNFVRLLLDVVFLRLPYDDWLFLLKFSGTFGISTGKLRRVILTGYLYIDMDYLFHDF